MSESPVTVAEEFDSSPGAAAKPYRRKRVTYGSAVDALKDMSAEKKEKQKSVMDATDLLPINEEPSQKESSLFTGLDDDEENGIQQESDTEENGIQTDDDDDKSKDGIPDDVDSDAEQDDNSDEKGVQQEMESSTSDAEREKEQSEEAKKGIQEDSDSSASYAEEDEEKATTGRTKRVVAAKGGSSNGNKKDAEDLDSPEDDDEKDDSVAQNSTTDDRQVQDVKDGNADTDSPTDSGKEETKARSVKKTQPKPDALVLSVDNLFVHADKETVTVSDIVRSLEAEYQVKLDKPTRSFVRSHLTSLMTGDVEPTVQDESEEEEEASDYEEEETKEASDVEEEETKKKPKKKKAPTRRRTRRKPPKKKPSAVRIHAEALRKRRIEELKVRNEELQLKQNKADQERAQQIAKKFETNTDELLLKRMEDRLDLLQKLDQKRITVISADGSQTTEVPNETQDQVETKEQDASSSEDDSSDEEMELEIIGVEGSSSSQSAGGIRLPSKSSALSMLDMACEFKSKPKRAVQTGKSRATLRSALVAKQRKAGNMWLARELGYKTEEEHLRDCMLVESKKRKEVVKKEEERVRTNERKLLRERMLTEASGAGEDFEEEEYTPDGEDDGDESDEEMAMAKEIEAEEAAQDTSEGNMETAAGAADDADAQEPTKDDESSEEAIEQPLSHGQSDGKSKDDTVDGDNPNDGENDRESTPEVEAPVDIPADTCNDTTSHPSADRAVSSKEQVDDATSTSQNLTSTAQQDIADFEADTGDDSLTEKEETNPGDPEDGGESESRENSDTAANPSDDGGKSESPEKSDAVQSVHDQSKKEKSGKSERNSGWKALLQKEAEKLKKSKGKKNGNGLVEAEAEEEEEEEVAGLEDFGFTVHKKTDDGDEEAVTDKVTEEDLKHVVDDLSDDEGDEDAGAAARKKLEQEEEKERHKEIIRRMREGYDGRRGGIAGAGVGARGIHRFDQLVAADNRDDAKRLGLLNDDEVDSDDDGEDTGDKGDDEIEDENALLDKMLKDRFLNRNTDEQVEENFSEDEEGEEEQADGKENNDEDIEQMEQERLAKRFAKRARMQRLIEQHGEDEEFSRSRLIDEDETTRLELKMMKSVSRLSRDMSVGSSRTSQSGESETGSEGKKETHGLSLGKNSLSLALQASRRTKKKTSFLGGNSGAAVKERSLSVKSVALGHVVFNTGGESQHSKPAQLNGVSTGKKYNHSSGKRKRAALQTSTSLWKKVSANGFKKSKMGAR